MLERPPKRGGRLPLGCDDAEPLKSVPLVAELNVLLKPNGGTFGWLLDAAAMVCCWMGTLADDWGAAAPKSGSEEGGADVVVGAPKSEVTAAVETAAGPNSGTEAVGFGGPNRDEGC